MSRSSIQKYTKSMFNIHQEQEKTKEKQNKGCDKEEKRIPMMRIRIKGKKAFIVNSLENSKPMQTDEKTEENVGSFSRSIADKVKLRKRGQRNTSDAELYKIISQSSLCTIRKRKRNPVYLSSEPSTLDQTSISSYDLPSKKPKLFINEKKSPGTDSEICSNIQEKDATASFYLHEYPMELNQSIINNIDVDRLIVKYRKEELKNLDPSAIEEFFSQVKELSTVRKRTNGYVDAMMDLAIQIEKQPDPEGISSKENETANKDNRLVVLSTLKHSPKARTGQNIPGLKDRICSIDSSETLIKQLSRSLSSHALSSKTHSSDYRNTHDINGVLGQENPAGGAKEKSKGEKQSWKAKEKRIDEAIEDGIMEKNEISMCKRDSRPQNKENIYLKPSFVILKNAIKARNFETSVLELKLKRS